MPVVTVDTRDFKRFAAQLRRASPDIALRLNRNLRVAGNVIKNDARSRLTAKGARFGVSTARGSVTIKVTGPRIVGLLERGSSGSSNAKSWRHPLFGHRPWYTQPTDPYLSPAVEAHRDEVYALVVEAVQGAFDEAARL